MNDLTKEELEVLKSITTPMVKFKQIENELNKNVIKLGYENYKDFLIKIGWSERFANE